MTSVSMVRRFRLGLTALGVWCAAAGCCCRWCCPAKSSAAPMTRPAAQAARQPLVQFGRQVQGDANAPGGVNVFGELKGARPLAVRAIGDANFQQHTYIDDGYDANVAVDPTGKWLAFASTRDSDHTNIFMQRADGTAVIQLTSESADDAYPAFSPDGRQIAFASTRAGNWQIFVMDVDGKNATQVTTGPMQAIHPSWCPDGTRLVYCSLGSKSNQWELWTANVQTNEKRMIGYGLFPAWSPSRESDRIAFQRPRQRGSRWFSLWTLDLVNGEATRLTEVIVSSNAAVLSPAWSPDGRRLAFATVMEPNAEMGPRAAGRTDIWTVNSDGTDRRRITDGTGTNLMPYWSGDNRIYFISDRGGAECVWSARAEPAKVFTVDARKDAGKTEAANVQEPEH